ncbi:hypothetical protein BC830DRAFT_1171483 [Chytriomyces sp. MP71]|nr:hypothetical protein BC830DRAFT_1171483 [Chytriomyces sp. MP71]
MPTDGAPSEAVTTPFVPGYKLGRWTWKSTIRFTAYNLAGLTCAFYSSLVLLVVSPLRILTPALFRVCARWSLASMASLAAIVHRLLVGQCGFIITGDAAKIGPRAIAMANHQTYYDWWFIGLFLWHQNGLAIQSLKIILMDILKYIPFYGWIAYFSDFIFLKQRWSIDQARLQSALEPLAKGNRIKESLFLLLFPEGLLVHSQNLESAATYIKKCKDDGKPFIPRQPKHVILPRSKGLWACLKHLNPPSGGAGNVDMLVDMTMGISPSSRGDLTGLWPVSAYDPFTIFGVGGSTVINGIHLDVRVIDKDVVKQLIALDETELDTWLKKVWEGKDDLMAYFHEHGTFVGFQRQGDLYRNSLPNAAAASALNSGNKGSKNPSIAGSTKSKSSFLSFRSTASSRSVVEENGLSITERFFFKTAPNKQQVLMCIMLRLRMPPSVQAFDPARVVDLVRIAQAKHYRLSAWVDHETLGALPFCEKASDLPTNYRLLERKSDNDWFDVYHDEINTNFDTDDVTRPLWRTSILMPQEWLPSSDSDLFRGQTPIVPVHRIKREHPIFYDRQVAGFGLSVPASVPDSKTFEIMFTFHHCLGDGLSMFAFARTFLDVVDAKHLNSKDLKLSEIVVSKDPPPVLDNLFNPNVVEILPAAVGMAFKALGKKSKRLGHSDENPGPDAPIVPLPSSQTAHAAPPSPSSSPEPQEGPSRGPSPEPIIMGPLSRTGSGHTNVRFMYFAAEFTNVLRKRAKVEKTTIGAVLVVASLAACRAVFVHGVKRDGGDVRKEVPEKQGWVVTNSIRHILPQSKLLQGGDRETDEALKVFGGYAGELHHVNQCVPEIRSLHLKGSVSNNLKINDDSHIWDRARHIKRSIMTSFRASIQRMKVANYAYRHPKIWKAAEKRIDLSKMSRMFSCEVANLNAWEYPSAPPDAPASDERVRVDYFGGGLNASFEGSRGLFSVGIITLGGNMSVFVCYDTKAVSVDEAEVFFRSFAQTLKRMSEAGHKATVADMIY